MVHKILIIIFNEQKKLFIIVTSLFIISFAKADTKYFFKKLFRWKKH